MQTVGHLITTHTKHIFWLILCLGIFLFTAICFGYIWHTQLIQAHKETQSMERTVSDLSRILARMRGANTDLSLLLNGEQQKNNAYAEQIQHISSTVNDLYKLSTTDKELLQKYSTVYFLNENYVPASLAEIDTTFLVRPEKKEYIHTTVKPYLDALLRDANTNGTSLSILSAYRSFGTQTVLKASYKVQYGTTAANKFSADQGYSEHQLGSTIDFTTPSTGDNLNSFEKTPAYTWLTAHAHEYGFVLSYPKGNKFYQFEPWHWRFVGVELATRLHTENKYFYDLNQRDIDAYLGKIFN